MKHKAELIKIDGTRTPMVPANGKTFELDELYKALGCNLIQVLNVGERLMVMDEEGMMNGKEVNATACLLAAPHTILGPVVLCDADMFD